MTPSHKLQDTKGLWADRCSRCASFKESVWNTFQVLYPFLKQVSRMFVEECTRYREYIHLLSFNYDFHLCKAQMYLNGSQRTFNKGYAITDMLKSLLLEYPHCPFFARNRACEGKSIHCTCLLKPFTKFSLAFTGDAGA